MRFILSVENPHCLPKSCKNVETIVHGMPREDRIVPVVASYLDTCSLVAINVPYLGV